MWTGSTSSQPWPATSENYILCDTVTFSMETQSVCTSALLNRVLAVVVAVVVVVVVVVVLVLVLVLVLVVLVLVVVVVVLVLVLVLVVVVVVVVEHMFSSVLKFCIKKKHLLIFF